MEKISNLTEQVKVILEKDPRTRDDDKLLCSIIWYKSIGTTMKTMSAVDFLKMYVNGDLVNHDTITRARRKVQEENISLRGENYSGRQAHQDDVKADLGYQFNLSFNK